MPGLLTPGWVFLSTCLWGHGFPTHFSPEPKNSRVSIQQAWPRLAVQIGGRSLQLDSMVRVLGVYGTDKFFPEVFCKSNFVLGGFAGLDRENGNE